jgi:hypothetical protein
MSGSYQRQRSFGQNQSQRDYTITYSDRNGHLADARLRAPATPVFEDAFAALGRGAMLETPHGLTAVEDLLPGDQVRLEDGSFAPMLWRGRITLHPADQSAMALTRVVTDALGPARPMRDLVLGPAARLCQCTRGLRNLSHRRAAYIPASDFVDGSQFIALRPVVPVDLYQIGLASHETMLVNGIGIESLHPGTPFSLGLQGELLDLYLSLFPHLQGFEDIGLLKHPRLRLQDLDITR